MGLVVAAVLGVLAVSSALDGPIYLDRQGPSSSSGAVLEGSPEVPISSASLWCPGPEQQGLADATVTEADQQVIVQGIAPPLQALGEGFGDPADGQLTLSSGAAAPQQVEERLVPIEGEIDTAEAGELVATGGLAAGLSGTQLWLGTQEQQTGLALTPCGQALDSAWLLAGGAQPGRAERLVLINPGRAPISVDVRVWGSAGSVNGEEGDPGSQIALEPGERRIVLLDALGPGVAAPAVHVVATGGPVTAYLGDRWLEGTADQGWELSVPTQEPASSHVIPAVIASEPNEEAASEAKPATLRVAVPGAESAVLQLQALTDRGPVDLPTDITVLPAEQVTDVELDDLPTGTHALAVDSDEPVVLSLQLSSSASNEGRSDIAWVPATEPIAGIAGTALPQPQGAEATEIGYRLHVASTDGAAVTVHRLGADGEVTSSDVAVPAGVATQTDLALDQGVWVEAKDGQVYAAVSARSQALVSDQDPTASSRTDQQGQDAESPSVDEVALIAVLPLHDAPRYRSLIDLVPQVP